MICWTIHRCVLRQGVYLSECKPRSSYCKFLTCVVAVKTPAAYLRPCLHQQVQRFVRPPQPVFFFFFFWQRVEGISACTDVTPGIFTFSVYGFTQNSVSFRRRSSSGSSLPLGSWIDMNVSEKQSPSSGQYIFSETSVPANESTRRNNS